MFGALKLRHRILVGYAVTVFLFAAAAVAVYTSIRSLESLERDLDDVESTTLTASKLETQAVKLQSAGRGLLIVNNDVLMDRFRKAEAEVKRLREALDTKVRGQKQRESLIKLNEGLNRTVQFYSTIVDYIKDDKSDKALEMVRSGTGIKLSGELRDLVAAFHERQSELSREVKSATSHARSVVYQVVGGGTLLVIVIAIASGFWIIVNANRSVGLATNTVSSSAKEIAATITQHERAAVAQAAMVNETNVTVDELNASSRQSAEQAAELVAVAQRASGITEEGRTIVGQAINGMTSLKDKVGSVADQILRLGEQTGQIGNIANVVKDLATQTNMLALNAAVEATRAGEHGKGFGVVASEVRKLADQSKKSAEEAYRIVSEIQRASNSTIMVTEEGIKTVDEVAGIARKVGDLFDSLSEEAGQVYETAQQVVLNARQQSSAISQIGEAMTNINAGSKETAAGITQTKQGLQDLEEAARNLRQIV